jgi:hypothetical protein
MLACLKCSSPLPDIDKHCVVCGQSRPSVNWNPALRAVGVVARLGLLCSIALLAYAILRDCGPPVGEIPFAALTLDKLFNGLFRGLSDYSVGASRGTWTIGPGVGAAGRLWEIGRGGSPMHRLHHVPRRPQSLSCY